MTDKLFYREEDTGGATKYNSTWAQWAQYISQDKTGRWYAYSEKPMLLGAPLHYFAWRCSGGHVNGENWGYLWTTCEHPKGWKNTCIDLRMFRDVPLN